MSTKRKLCILKTICWIFTFTLVASIIAAIVTFSKMQECEKTYICSNVNYPYPSEERDGNIIYHTCCNKDDMCISNYNYRDSCDNYSLLNTLFFSSASAIFVSTVVLCIVYGILSDSKQKDEREDQELLFDSSLRL